jgi:hypothetical protein
MPHPCSASKRWAVAGRFGRVRFGGWCIIRPNANASACVCATVASDLSLHLGSHIGHAIRNRTRHMHQRTRRDRVCAGGGGGSGMQHVRNERKAAQDDLRVTSPSLESSDSQERTCLWNGIES